VDSSYTHDVSADGIRSSWRVQAVSMLGPVTAAAGLIWAFLQPYRLTVLHPRGEGFWWLVLEPQLLVILAGAVFALVVARPLLVDLEVRGGTTR
jgi:hypothetical protein